MASTRIIQATLQLRESLRGIQFSSPADYVYSPLEYAWAPHEAYLSRYAPLGSKRVLFLGMNPGPFGMAQTGIPFGEVAAVRDWLGLEMSVGRPDREHPRKKVTGFACHRSEVSGRRLWGLFRDRFGTPENFFREHWVHNYNPLLFLENTKLGRNVVPEELPAQAIQAVNQECDLYLQELVQTLGIKTVVGVGGYAETRAREALQGMNLNFGRILHPSPASPVANRGWAEAATRELIEQRIWH